MPHTTIYISEEFNFMLKEIKKFDDTFNTSAEFQRIIAERFNKVQEIKFLNSKEEEKKKEVVKEDRTKEFAESFIFFFDITQEQAEIIAKRYNELPKEERKSIIYFGTKIGLKERENEEEINNTTNTKN